MNLLAFVERYLKKDLVLVYQYGKVGSTALCQSIPGALNVHDLYGTMMCEPAFKVRYSKFYRLVVFPVDRLIRRVLLRLRSEVKIIVPLRDPSDRNVSMFFQDIPFWYVEYFRKNGRENNKEEGVDLLQRIFCAEFPHDACDVWFEREFSRFTGIAIDDILFDKERGNGLVSRGKYTCLFVHHNRLADEDVKRVISDFCGVEFELLDSNRGERKWYAAGYKEFVGDCEFIDDYKKRGSGRVFRQFYM